MPNEPTKVITVRVPRSVHRLLEQQAKIDRRKFSDYIRLVLEDGTRRAPQMAK